MADVKLKNGYVRVVNNLVDQLFLREFSLKQLRVIMLILRLSYGYNKKYAIIKPKSRFNFANLHNPDINKILNELIAKKVIIKIAEDCYSFNKDYDVWEIPYHKFYNEKKYKDLLALQFVSETLTTNMSESLTSNISETLTKDEGELVNHLQNLKKDEQITNTNISETLTKNENLLVNHLQEQPENVDSEGDINPPKDIIKDNIKTCIKDIHIGEDKKNTPKFDPYFNNPITDNFKAQYKKILKKDDCWLDNFKINKLLEIKAACPDFEKFLPEILTKFSKITFSSGNKPTLKWLIQEGGWAGILNGEYDQYIPDESSKNNTNDNKLPDDWDLDDLLSGKY